MYEPNIIQEWNALGKIEDAGAIVKGGGIDRYWQREDVQLHPNYYTGTEKIYKAKWLHDSNEALNHFNLRSIEFGNWMNQEDRANFLYASMLGLHQLALIFGVSDNQIGLGGKLSIALGARGHGKAAGHYEATPYSVINITKTAGIGVLAHEYAHALDNIISFYTKSKQTFVSGGRTTRKRFDNDIAQKGNYFEQQFEQFFNILYYDEEENETDFLEAIKQKDEYWQRRNEVFARTFEVYISDKQKARKHPNHFLAPTSFGKAYPDIALVRNVSRLIGNIISKGFSVMDKTPSLKGIEVSITGYKGFRKTLLENADLEDTLKNMKRIALRDAYQVRELAKSLEKPTVAATSRNIWDYLRANTHYKLDQQGLEELRTPARSIIDGKAGLVDPTFGIDCDDYTILISALLLNLGIPHEYRVAAYQQKGKFQHIYPVAFDEQGNEYVIDVVPEIPHFNYEEQPIADLKIVAMPYLKNELNQIINQNRYGSKMTTMELQELSGLAATTEREIRADLINDINEPFSLSGVNDDIDDMILEGSFLSGFGEVATKEEADIVISTKADAIQLFKNGILAEVNKAKKLLVEELKKPTALSKVVNVPQEIVTLNRLISSWNDELEREQELKSAIELKSSYKNFYKALALSLHELNKEAESLDGLDDEEDDTPIYLAKIPEVSVSELLASEDADENDVSGLGFLKKLRGKIKSGFNKVFNKVKAGVKTVVKAVVRYNPATIAVRAAILLTLKTNAFNIASRLIYGYLTQQQAEANGLDLNEWRKIVDAKNKGEDFFTKVGGKAENFRNSVVKGKAAKATGLNLSGLGEGDGKASGFVSFITKLLSKINITKLFKKKPKPSTKEEPQFVDETDFTDAPTASNVRVMNNNQLPNTMNDTEDKPSIFKRAMTKDFWKNEVFGSKKGLVIAGSISLVLVIVIIAIRFGIRKYKAKQKKRASALKGAKTRKRNQRKQLALTGTPKRSTPRKKAAPRKPATKKGQLKGSTTIVKHATKSRGKSQAKISVQSNANRLRLMHAKAKQLQKSHPKTKYSKLLSMASKEI